MPTFRSFDEFGRELHRLQVDLERDDARRIITEVGVKAQQIARAAASSDLGGDPKFSGWAPVLETKLKYPKPGTAILSPTRSSAGPWTVAEFGRHQKAGPRLVGPRLTKSGRLSTARQKRWNGRTQPKHTASEAVARFEGEMVKIVGRGLRRVTKKHFD